MARFLYKTTKKITRIEDLPDGENTARRCHFQQNRLTAPQPSPTRYNPRQNIPPVPQAGTSGTNNHDQLNYLPSNRMPQTNSMPVIPPSRRINSRPIHQARLNDNSVVATPTNCEQQSNLIDWDNEVLPATVTLQPLQDGAVSITTNKTQKTPATNASMKDKSKPGGATSTQTERTTCVENPICPISTMQPLQQPTL